MFPSSCLHLEVIQGLLSFQKVGLLSFHSFFVYVNRYRSSRVEFCYSQNRSRRLGSFYLSLPTFLSSLTYGSKMFFGLLVSPILVIATSQVDQLFQQINLEHLFQFVLEELSWQKILQIYKVKQAQTIISAFLNL